jgi:glutathione synthase/RimK-type ligase-like ATP-grasp enzyme
MRQVADKWNKFDVLKRHKGVARHIPPMLSYNAENLRQMLDSHDFIVAKPLIGTGGNGVVKIVKISEDLYSCHYRRKNVKLDSWNKLIEHINRIRRGRNYMLQKGIHLITIQGKPVDYRVKMVKDKSIWKITAVVARVARTGQFVTNLCNGGTMLKGFEALRSTYPSNTAKLKKRTMTGVARTSTRLLEKEYPGIGSLGFDFGVDQKGKIWMFEVNTRPS